MPRVEILFSIACLLVSTGALAAAPPGPASTIYLDADQVDIDDKQGISIYVGNVKLTRDLMTITADKMTVYRDKQDLKKVIAVGAPQWIDDTICPFDLFDLSLGDSATEHLDRLQMPLR